MAPRKKKSASKSKNLPQEIDVRVLALLFVVICSAVFVWSFVTRNARTTNAIESSGSRTVIIRPNEAGHSK
jgi:hypothetical protein